jgi:protein TonB
MALALPIATAGVSALCVAGTLHVASCLMRVATTGDAAACPYTRGASTPPSPAIASPGPQSDEIALPPPPPPPPALRSADASPLGRPAAGRSTGFIAPVEVPDEIRADENQDLGVEGGVPGGVEGGVVGGLGDTPLSMRPVRVGGQIKEPKKLRHVAPVYPPIARSARLQGVVILEGVISPQGRVTDARIVRGIPLLDEAAVDAVRQWVYTPTLLNGVPVPVIMTITVAFRLEKQSPDTRRPLRTDSYSYRKSRWAKSLRLRREGDGPRTISPLLHVVRLAQAHLDLLGHRRAHAKRHPTIGVDPGVLLAHDVCRDRPGIVRLLSPARSAGQRGQQENQCPYLWLLLESCRQSPGSTLWYSRWRQVAQSWAPSPPT